MDRERRFTPADLRHPLIQAPMAGGPSTPELVAAVTASGALGFLAGGYLTAAALDRQIKQTREAVGAAPFGVNLFVPQPVAEPDRVAAYRRELEATHGVTLPDPDLADTDAWAEKTELLLDDADPVAVMSFTFGLPDEAVLRRFKKQGTYTVGTVTTVDEARLAAARGVDALCVQGPEAGGHRGTFDPSAAAESAPLADLLAKISAAVRLPLIAAGGLATAADAARARAAGARLTQHGTAFLRADEAGTQQLHRAALADPEFAETVMTRAFSGRWARALRNGFTDQHPAAPAAYPAINQLTRPLRAAAAQRGDAQGLSLYAGVRHAEARAASAAEIVADLAGS